MKKKMGRGVLFAVIVAAAVLAAAAGGAAWYMHALRSGNDFLTGTRINGTSVSGKTPAEAAVLFRDEFEGGQVVLTENGKEVFHAALPDLGYTLDTEALEKTFTEYVEAEKADLRSVLDVLREGNAFSVQLPYRLDEEIFREAVRAEALSVPRKKNENAKILYYEKERKCKIKPEVQGTELDDEDLQTWLRGEVEAVLGASSGNEASGGVTADAGEGHSGEAAAELSAEKKEGGPADCTVERAIPKALYIPPEKTADDEKMQEKCRILNEYAGETVTYVFGDKTETLDFKTFMNWLKIKDGKVSVKEDEVRAYVRKLAGKYETRYRERDFTTTWGNVVTFSPGLNEYGYTILEDEETAQLMQDLLSGKSVEREPVYQIYGPWGDPLFLKRSGTDDLAGTYVEVSISAQHMWYYIDGALFVESDVVTGDVTLDQGTATGVFPLAFKQSPSILRGGEGKKKYETKVQYWMPFYEGQGLHDAWWKSVFGGSEYIGNGSHGCVNLPPSVAETVYNNIVPGTAIIIYY